MKKRFRMTLSGGLDDYISDLSSMQDRLNRVNYDRYARTGVNILKTFTPKVSEKTANSWEYKISKSKHTVSIEFFNTNYNNGVPIAILLQYGHASRNGSWVSGVDYLTPATKTMMEELSKDLWEEVTE